jgi:hypothetical protein
MAKSLEFDRVRNAIVGQLEGLTVCGVTGLAEGEIKAAKVDALLRKAFSIAAQGKQGMDLVNVTHQFCVHANNIISEYLDDQETLTGGYDS